LPANPHFVGRQPELLALAAALKGGGAAGITTGGAPAQPTLVAQLRTLQRTIAQAGQAGFIDEECAIDVDAALQKAIRQADKATPDRQAIQAHLATARDKLASIPVASGLVTAIDAIRRY
jgi:hypothetical protein